MSRLTLVKPDGAKPFLEENLTLTQRIRTLMNGLVDAQNIISSGSPEGIQASKSPRLYIDESNTRPGGTLYVKPADAIDGDPLLGWELVSGIAGTGEKIVETDIDHQIILGNEIINCSGALNITAILFANAVDEVTITAINAVCNFLADVTIQGGGAIPLGTSSTFYPARNQWFRK